MTDRFLVRARLRRDLAAAALAPLLVPSDSGGKVGAAHRLVWALFADGPDRRRDFLWRQTRPGEFLILAARPPADPHGLFTLDYKPFAPALREGQRLQFDLRANPVVALASAGSGRRGRRKDVVTRAIAGLPPEPCPDRRRARRWAASREAAAAWLAAQGARHGFAPDLDAERLRIDGEDWVRIPRDDGRTVTFLAVTFQGVLTVQDPARFLARLPLGFGAAKAFGCGLMLIRRAPGSPRTSSWGSPPA